ncbi:MAG TPA: murein L,D-transpeptidase catalytic domain family protein [Sphingobacteriaceae bacterium]
MKRYTFWSITMLLITLVIFVINRRSAAELTVVSVQAAEKGKDALQADSSLQLSVLDIFDNYISDSYYAMELDQAGLDLEVFKKAVTGYYNLKNNGSLTPEKDILSIADFTLSSKAKRLWVVDLADQKLLFNTYVAHGRGSGNDMASAFSNVPNSHQSSLGFYIANETYFGKHGLSLKLDGMDQGFNSNARNRAIVVHGANYVSESSIRQLGRLGRSHGCPAVPMELTRPIINTIKGKTVLFINGQQTKYESAYLNGELAASNFAKTAPMQAKI